MFSELMYSHRIFRIEYEFATYPVVYNLGFTNGTKSRKHTTSPGRSPDVATTWRRRGDVLATACVCRDASQRRLSGDRHRPSTGMLSARWPGEETNLTELCRFLRHDRVCPWVHCLNQVKMIVSTFFSQARLNAKKGERPGKEGTSGEEANNEVTHH